MSDSKDASGEEDLRHYYSIIRSRISSDKALTLLHIGAHQTIIWTETDKEAVAVLVLTIGSEKTGSELFHHAPPDAGRS